MRQSGLFGALIDDALSIGTLVRFRAEGGSMHPTIRDGETITIAPAGVDEIVRGDVLLCRHDRRMLAHRVVGVGTRVGVRVFELRGDAKAACDAPVVATDIVGRVIAVSRNGRAIPLSGRGARLRYRARATAARLASIVYHAVVAPRTDRGDRWIMPA